MAAVLAALPFAHGCVEPAQAQRAPSALTAAARAPAPAEESGGAPRVAREGLVAPSAPLEGALGVRPVADTPRFSDTPVAQESTYPVYPPAPTAYPLDEEGNPIFGLDIAVDDPTGTSLRSFHAALRRAERGEGQARIIVYGASHVASDTWTGMTRTLLQTRFGDAGHGFVLPAAPWRSYHHQGVIVDSTPRLWEARRFHTGQSMPERFGLAGVAVETDDPRAWGRVTTNDHTASRFELFYEVQPGGGTFDVLIDGQLASRVETAAPTPIGAYQLFTVPDGSHSFEVRPRGNGLVKIYGVAVEREQPGVILDALGINGARAASQLQWDEALYQEHLRRRMPDLVILAYGTNESGDDEQPLERYEADVRRVVERMQRTVPMASCLLVGPSDRPIVARDGTVTPRARTYDVIAVQRRVAREYGCGFFDLVAFGGGPMHMLEWSAASPAWGASDRIHFTRRAYDRLGQVISNALLAGY